MLEASSKEEKLIVIAFMEEIVVELMINISIKMIVFIVMNKNDNNDKVTFMKASLPNYIEIVLSKFQKSHHRLIFIIIIEFSKQ